MGELDIVARDGKTIVFAEVKARSSGRCGTPFESVTAAKQRRLCSMAAEYLLRRRLVDCSCRFDVVAITVEADGATNVEIVAGAFDCKSG